MQAHNTVYISLLTDFPLGKSYDTTNVQFFFTNFVLNHRNKPYTNRYLQFAVFRVRK